MATIRLDEAALLESSRAIPLTYFIEGNGEPYFDYNEEGEAQDFQIDLEPEDATEAVNLMEELVDVSPSEFAETAIRVPEAGRVSDFSFLGREYLKRIYDTPANKVLLQCGRQVEKTVLHSSMISMEDGSVHTIEEISVGDRVIGLSSDGAHTGIGSVTWKSKRYTKPCVRIKTRQGHSVTVALTHPMRQWGKWEVAGALTEQEHLAVVRKAGYFTGQSIESDAWIIIAACMVAEGSTCGTPSFTQNEGELLSDFIDCCHDVGVSYTPHDREVAAGLNWQLNFVRDGREDSLVKTKLMSWGIYGEKSAVKHIPAFVWGLDQRQTALFLNRLWAGDGHASLQDSSYHLEYDSVSELLVKDVQRLLWKFGIPSSTRRWKPTLYKGTDKWAYKLRIETQEGALRFIKDVGALGKTEDLPIVEVDANSNRDIYPAAIVDDLAAIHRSRSGYQRRGQYVPQPSLRSVGLRERPKYLLSKDKLKQYVDFFRSDDRFDQVKTEQLAQHLCTDLYWDEIVSIEEVGEQDCYDITVEGTASFIADGFITHNSTTLGNRLLCYSALTNNFRSLYVAPSAEQAKVFSNDRIKDVIDSSPMLRSYTSSKINQAVFFKKFINYSQIRLRYAYLSADRCLVGSSRLQLANGSFPAIRDLVGREVDLISANDFGVPLVAKGVRIRRTSVRSVVDVFTSFPISLGSSTDHEYFTQRGWVRADALHKGDFIAAPHAATVCTSTESIGVDFAWLLGAMTAEGSSVLPSDVKFTNTDLSFLSDFEKHSKAVGLILGNRVEDKRSAISVYSISLYSDSHGPGINGAKRRLWELGEFGKDALSKRIPACIFSAPMEEKRAFLNALFRGDGWCCVERSFARAGYATSSIALAEDLALLLWSLGVRCALRNKKPSTKCAAVGHVVDLSAASTHTLLSLIGDFRLPIPTRALPGKSNLDRIPYSYDRLRKYLYSEHGLSTHTAWTKYRIQLRPGNRKDSIGRYVLKSIAAKLYDQFLLDMCDPSISWVEVKRIEKRHKKEQLYCLDVPEYERFVANGLVVHNCRGIPADMVLIDELQDILVDNIPVIEQCAFHSSYKLFLYSGTPKSVDNTIAHYWSEFSTQNEWVVPCDRHGLPSDQSTWHWNILAEKNIGTLGLICDKCGELINARHPKAQWAAMQPMTEDNKDKVTFEGYRVPQIMVPWVDWEEITVAQEQYSRAQFMNEKLGMSYDSGVRPITRAQLQAICRPELEMGDIEEFRRLAQGRSIYAGIDWGPGESASYTHISFGGYLGSGNFTIFWCHRFTGQDLDPERQLDLITQMCTQLQVRIIGVDYGGGFYPNDKLIKRFGAHKVMKYQYNPRQKKKIYWEPNLKRWMTHRTEVMSDLFNAMKAKKIDLPRWEDYKEPHGSDVLNIFTEYNERLRMNEYKKQPGKTDDAFHSHLLCLLAACLENPRPDIFAPLQDSGLAENYG